MAAQNGHHDAVNTLVKAGADSKIPSLDGTTALFLAAQNGHHEGS